MTMKREIEMHASFTGDEEDAISVTVTDSSVAVRTVVGGDKRIIDLSHADWLKVTGVVEAYHRAVKAAGDTRLELTLRRSGLSPTGMAA